MNKVSNKEEAGFTLLEISIVLLLISIVAAFATPKITSAMRQYRLNMATRQIADLVQRGKAEAVSENRKASLVVDTSKRKIGLVVYNSSGAVLRTDYVPLPDGVTFARPANNPTPVPGAPTNTDVSFPAQNGSSTIFQQDFTPRGFLSVSNPGTMNAIYFSSGSDFRAITITSIGGTRTFCWKADNWQTMRS